jgi:hypothetical protein
VSSASNTPPSNGVSVGPEIKQLHLKKSFSEIGPVGGYCRVSSTRPEVECERTGRELAFAARAVADDEVREQVDVPAVNMLSSFSAAVSCLYCSSRRESARNGSTRREGGDGL